MNDDDGDGDALTKYNSWVWHYGKLCFQTDPKTQEKQSKWSCNKCQERNNFFIKSTKSTTHIGEHLKLHGITRSITTKPIRATLLDVEQATTNRIKGFFDPDVHKKKRGPDLGKFRRDMTLWICVCRQAFRVVENEKFRDMIADLSPEAMDMLPKSANTIRSWVINEFNKQKDIIKERLAIAQSRIHLTMDIWTTPSGDRSYLGIVASWIDIDHKINNILIALPSLIGQHTGVNIAATAMQVIEEYESVSELDITCLIML